MEDGNVRGGRIGFQVGGHLEAIHPRHVDVQHNHIEEVRSRLRQRLLTAGGFEHGVAAVLQQARDEGARHLFIIHIQHDRRVLAFRHSSGACRLLGSQTVSFVCRGHAPATELSRVRSGRGGVAIHGQDGIQDNAREVGNFRDRR